MALTPDEQAAVARWLAAGNQPKKVPGASPEPTDHPPRRIVRDNQVDDAALGRHRRRQARHFVGQVQPPEPALPAVAIALWQLAGQQPLGPYGHSLIDAPTRPTIALGRHGGKTNASAADPRSQSAQSCYDQPTKRSVRRRSFSPTATLSVACGAMRQRRQVLERNIRALQLRRQREEK
jgi:hypothetical protein